MKVEGKSQIKVDPKADLPTLEKALKAWEETMIPILEVWSACGGVVGRRAPTKEEVLAALKDMARQLESPAAWVPPGMFVLPLELELLLNVFPTEIYHLNNYESHVRLAVTKMRERVERQRAAPHWDGKATNGNILPPVGYKVSIHLGRSDAWVNHTVVGHAVTVGSKGQLMAHIHVIDDKGFPNQRLWSDVRPPV